MGAFVLIPVGLKWVFSASKPLFLILSKIKSNFGALIFKDLHMECTS